MRAGIPSVVIPFFGDQPFWAWRLEQNGVAPKMLKRKTLTAEKLADAINMASMPDMQIAATELAGKISNENGVQSAIALLTQWGLLTPPDINDVPVLNDDAAYPKTATTV